MRMDPKEQFLRQVSIIVKAFGVVVLVSIGGFWLWNPFLMVPGLALSFGIIRLGFKAVKSTWKEFASSSCPTVGDYWGATLMCGVVILFLFAGFIGAISIVVGAFQNRL